MHTPCDRFKIVDAESEWKIVSIPANNIKRMCRVIQFMVTHPVISGILYGVCVYLVMYGLVLRFSAIHSTRYPWQYPWPVLTGNLLIHMLGIGLTIALVVRRFSK